MRKLRSVGPGRLIAVAILVLLIALITASPVGGMETRSGDRIVIGPDEVVDDDLYATANEVEVDGTIRGDLIAFGSTVTVNGTVEGDLIAAGQSVKIGGTVDDDARIAGQTLLLGEGAEVNDDLIAAAYSLENEPNSAVGGTLLYAGYQALLQGTVGEDLNAVANGLELGGEVGGNVDAEVDGEDGGPPSFVFAPQADVPAVASGLTLTDSARVRGNLSYESSREAQISPQAQIEGEVTRSEQPAEEEETYTLADALLDTLRSFVALLVVGLLLIWLAPNWIRRRAGTVLERPLASLGWGVLALIAFMVLGVAILLATIVLVVIFGLLTLGGLVALIIVLGLVAEVLLLLAFWISTNYLAQIIVSLLAGVLLIEAVRSGGIAGRGVLPLVVGLILYVLLRAIPVLGAIVGLAVVLLGLGALLHWIWTKLRPSRSTPSVTE